MEDSTSARNGAIEYRIYLQEYCCEGLFITGLIHTIAQHLNVPAETIHYEMNLNYPRLHYLSVPGTISPDKILSVRNLLFLNQRPVKDIAVVNERRLFP